MEYYLAVRRKDMLQHVWTLKTLVSENSQMQKTIFYDDIVWFPLYDTSRMSKFIEVESRLMVSRGSCEGWCRLIVNGYSVVFGGDESVLELDRDCSCKYCGLVWGQWGRVQTQKNEQKCKWFPQNQPLHVRAIGRLLAPEKAEGNIQTGCDEGEKEN